jgi:oligopeptidase A
MENPLLSVGLNVPFDRISAEHVEPAISELIRRSEAALDAIESAPRRAMLDQKALTFGSTALYASRSAGVVATLSKCSTMLIDNSSCSVARSSAPSVAS